MNHDNKYWIVGKVMTHFCIEKLRNICHDFLDDPVAVTLGPLAAELGASDDLLIQVALTRRLSTFSTPNELVWRPLSVDFRPRRQFLLPYSNSCFHLTHLILFSKNNQGGSYFKGKR